MNDQMYRNKQMLASSGKPDREQSHSSTPNITQIARAPFNDRPSNKTTFGFRRLSRFSKNPFRREHESNVAIAVATSTPNLPTYHALARKDTVFPSVNSLYSIGESGPSSDCHSDYRDPHNQYGPEFNSMGGSVCNLDALPNYGEIDYSDYASETSSYFSSIDRRIDHQNHPHDQNHQQSPYGMSHTSYTSHASPATSPNHSTDLAIREGKKKSILNFKTIFNRDSSKQQQTSSVNDLHSSKTNQSSHDGSDSHEESRNFRTIREIQPRAFKFYMEQRVDNLLKAASERFERKRQLELEMQNHNMTEHERYNMRQLLRKKETNHLRLIRAKLSKGQFDIIKVLGKVCIFDQHSIHILYNF